MNTLGTEQYYLFRYSATYSAVPVLENC